MGNKWQKEKRLADNRVNWMIRNKINWFAPTISPAPKNIENNEIESVEEALKYFQPYTNKVSIQVKRMGSYCAMYLYRNHDKSYFVSRNGYVINHVQGLHEASCEVHGDLFTRFGGNFILAEAELMPWRTLGEGLIEREYGNYGHLHEDHLNFLKKTSAVEKIIKIRDKQPWEKGELKPHEKRQYTSIQEIALPDIDGYEKSINKYKEQYDIFGREGEIEFKVFNILKVDEEIVPTQYSLDERTIIRADEYNEAKDYFKTVKNRKLEGIVVKPYNQGLINIAPSLKVRTNDYLQLIYGVNFDRDYDYYFERRRIKRKISQSIKDYEIAQQLLRINRDSLVKENRKYVSLLYQAIDSEKYTKTLDTRL